MNSSYILFFDSGIGGLTTLKETINLLPNEDYLYLADDKNCPYGNKSEKEIENYVLDALITTLNAYKVKLIVFACNTATTCLVEKLREKFNISIVGTEPAILPAMRVSINKKILVLATNLTSSQDKFKNLKLSAGGEVFCHVFPSLASDIEKNLVSKINFDIDHVLDQIEKLISNNDIDALVLGCTHYCYLKDRLKELNINVFDGNNGVAKRVRQMLERENSKKEGNKKGELKVLLTSGDKEKAKKYVEIFKRL